MSGGRRLLLWLARERPPSASPVLRGMSKTIGWLVPVAVVSLVITRELLVPEASEPLRQAYPDLCEHVPAASLAELAGTTEYESRLLDRDGSECVWTVDGEDTDARRLTVRAGRPDPLLDESWEKAADERYESELVIAAMPFDEAVPEPVAGLGDEAAWFADTGEDRSTGALVVRRGTQVLYLEIVAPESPLGTLRGKAEAVAAALLPLLPAD